MSREKRYVVSTEGQRRTCVPAGLLYEHLCNATGVAPEQNRIALAQMQSIHDTPPLKRSLYHQHQFAQYWVQWSERLHAHSDTTASDNGRLGREHVWYPFPFVVDQAGGMAVECAVDYHLVFTVGQLIVLQDKMLDTLFSELQCTPITAEVRQWQAFAHAGQRSELYAPTRHSIPKATMEKLLDDVLNIINLCYRTHVLDSKLQHAMTHMALHYRWLDFVWQWTVLRIIAMWFMACASLLEIETNKPTPRSDEEAGLTRQRACSLFYTIESIIGKELQILYDKRLSEFIQHLLKGVRVESRLVVAEEAHSHNEWRVAYAHYSVARNDLHWYEDQRLDYVKAKVVESGKPFLSDTDKAVVSAWPQPVLMSSCLVKGEAKSLERDTFRQSWQLK